MHRRVTFAVLLLVSLAGARPAAAQLTPFVMSDLSEQNWIGADLGFGIIDADDTSIIHLSGLVEWAVKPNMKIYGRLPLMRAEGDFFDGAGLGNITAGGRMLWPSGGHTWSAHLALSIPTAADDGEDGLASSITSAYELPHDAGWWVPNTTTVRFGGDFGIERSSFFFQAQMGLHFLLIDDQEDLLLIKYAIGGGARVSDNLAIIGELNGYSDIFDDDAFGPDDTRTSIDLGVRYRTGRLVLGGRLYVPLDDMYRDDDVVGVIFDLRADM